MVRANCRDTLSAGDFGFIVDTLSKTPSQSVSLGELLTDDILRDELLDHELVFQKILDSPLCHNISPAFYFYVVVRHVLLEMNVDDRSLADYIASLLAHFARTENILRINELPDENLRYVTDMLIRMEKCTPEQAFAIQVHIGNLTLYLTGVFPENIELRTKRKGAPSLDFYERIGASQYALVSKHQIARKNHLDHVYQRLSGDFPRFRAALNQVSERFMHWQNFPLFPSSPGNEISGEYMES